MLNKLFKDLIQKTQHLITTSTQSEKPTIIVGLSGGPDSVFLLTMMHTYQHYYPITLIAAHLDHGWRENSAQDASFCQELCNKLGIPLIIEHATTYKDTIPYNGSLEEVGRIMRRRFFTQLAEKHTALVALGHHADDQEETFILRLLRGSSLQGLCSIRAVALPYIRPLLEVKKQTILDFLDANTISYCIDHTNSSSDFLRNRIRHIALPALYSCDNRFGAKSASTIAHLQETEHFMTQETLRHKKLLFNQENKGSCIIFSGLHTAIKKRIVLGYLIEQKVTIHPSDGLLQEIITFLQHPRGGIHFLRPPFHIHKKQGFFWICTHSC